MFDDFVSQTQHKGAVLRAGKAKLGNVACLGNALDRTEALIRRSSDRDSTHSGGDTFVVLTGWRCVHSNGIRGEMATLMAALIARWDWRRRANRVVGGVNRTRWLN